jgi:hypothetical protein
MLHRRKLLAGLSLAVAAVLTTAAIAVASSRPELTAPKTIHVESVGGHVAILQLNPNKHTFFGNQFVIVAPVFNAAGTHRRGHLHGVCTFMDKAGVAADCSITLFLAQGEVLVRGLVDFSTVNHTTGAIVGGSGMYRNARGQVTFVNSTGDTEGFILQLEP